MSSVGTGSAVEVQFAIGLPTSWRSLPTDPGPLRSELADLLASMPDVGDDERDRLATALAWHVRRGQARGLAVAAFFAEVLGGSEGEDPLLLSAAVSVAFVGAEELDGPLTIELLQRAAVDEDPRVSLLAAPRVVELGCGPAVEAVALRRIGDGTRTAEVLDVRYLAPVADGMVLAIVHGTSPSVGLGPELGEVFLRIAESIEVFSG